MMVTTVRLIHKVQKHVCRSHMACLLSTENDWLDNALVYQWPERAVMSSNIPL